MPLLPSHPLLTPAEAARLERTLFDGDEAREWAAMQRAAAGIAAGIRDDLAMVAAEVVEGRVLLLAGKGHNAGDAFLAAANLLATRPGWRVEVGFVFGIPALRPLAERAWRRLVQQAPDRVRAVKLDQLAPRYTVILDGVFGFQFRPPLPEAAAAWCEAANRTPAALRAAVDLPTGWDDPRAFQADATYATGSIKAPILDLPAAGRVRWIDLGFFHGDEAGDDRILTAAVLDPLRAPRPVQSDKRTYGHVFVIGGSRSFPGAVLMAVQAALRAGAGLVTAFVPETLAPAYAAAWPEAMWHGCPETSEGGLAIDASREIRARLDRAQAVLVGPGLGREAETLAVVTALIREAQVPVVMDADALQPQLVWAGSCPRVLTPHAGEFARIAQGADFRSFRGPARAVTVLKGPVTRVSDGSGTIYHSLFGGPVLARGGSGDMLGGIVAALLAHDPGHPLRAAGRAVVWHGQAADRLARMRGEVAVRATELLDHLGPVLRHE